MKIEKNSSNSITARMLESPSSCSSSSLPLAVFSSIKPSPNSPSPINDDLKTTTTTNYIEIGCKENVEKIQNFYIQPQNDQREPTAYKNLSPSVKNEIQDDGYETSGGDVLTPNCVVLPKCEIPLQDDPYNFVDDELNHLSQQQYSSTLMSSITNTIAATAALTAAASQQLSTVSNSPKKRGRKKKIKDDEDSFDTNGTLKPIVQKERKKHDRFNGMPEEEVSKRTLPDHLAPNLDIIIIGINPGLFAAYKGHHYAGPGNHFWKCLYLSGLTQEQMTADEDFKLMDFGIGFTNMVERATKGSADLTRKEIKEGCRILHEKLRQFRPKIAVFNGKLIFEVFSGKKDFSFGRQPELIDGTNSYMWVMPSSSARCAQLPRAADKVPFYAALKKFRDYLNGVINELDETDVVFNDPKYKTCCEIEKIITNKKIEVDGKKKRGRPKKIKSSEQDFTGDEQIKISIPRKIVDGGFEPKKKRGRPKKNKDGVSKQVPQQRISFHQQQQRIEQFDDTTTPTTPPNDFHDEILTNLNNHQFPFPQQQYQQQQHYQHEQIDHHYHHHHHLHQIQQQQNYHQFHQNFHQQNEIEQFSDLSTEISAAITSEHDTTTTTTSTNDFEQQQTETTELRYLSPVITEQNHDYSSYRNYETTGSSTTTTSDVSTKSLSGLESLVDQIPNLTDLEQPVAIPPQFVETEQQFGNSCIFSDYTNPYQTSYQSPSSYNGFVPNFSNSTSMTSSYSNQFLDSSSIFPTYYNNYSQVHPTIHMPSPNYPYGYSHSGFGPPAPHHTILGKNLKIFERIKPDIKNASF